MFYCKIIQDFLPFYNGTIEIILLKKLCIYNISKMVFEVDKKTQTHYATPMGEMLVEMTTSRIGFEEEDDHLKVEVEYSLDINYDHVSDCRIVRDVTSKGCAKLELGEA